MKIPKGNKMPAAQIKSLAKESGKTVEEVEKEWENAKDKANQSGNFPKCDTTKKRKENNCNGYWAYVYTVTRSILGLEKEKIKAYGKVGDLLND